MNSGSKTISVVLAGGTPLPCWEARHQARPLPALRMGKVGIAPALADAYNFARRALKSTGFPISGDGALHRAAYDPREMKADHPAASAGTSADRVSSSGCASVWYTTQ